MKKQMFSIALTSLLAAAVMAGCGTGTSQPPAQPQNGQELAGQPSGEKKTLTMATSADYKPYEFHDLTSGKDEIVGFDVDIAKYIGEQLGYEVQVNDMNFDGLVPALQTNRADFVMAGMTPTPERQKNVDFSEIYYDAKNTIVSKKESNVIKPDQLAGKKVAVQLGSIQESAAKELAKTATGLQITSLNKTGEIIEEVKTGRVDAAILEDTVAKGFVESNPGLQYTTIETEEVNGSAIAFPKGSKHVDEFNQVIKKMQENGEMDKLIKKWFGQ
ncbi:transporter substrate-binding domain-containing protein [Brevibacillus centrosporus]|uniref:transporter substrate-binding domain-containing protein n=1 Tax=Brevibacillus centrosporus TaxID=54910 RepID=UPI000F0A3311|nr:transporter substrate-binding domain-containing protein [Brevibacillus centrosporus]MEC2128289.1 transporter substrate-binding domain-containing protein [Brevibacillus centrosporus]RNB73858.1 ABC transporter substrate-binding protein [Brevibacillus centrosporus]GED30751.1 ABC transporter substrate-binding protein [Brevibacillus centrosporus]